MDINTKNEILATIVKDLVTTMDPYDINPVRRYNILKDLDRIIEGVGVVDEYTYCSD